MTETNVDDKKRWRGYVYTMNNYDKHPELIANRDALVNNPDVVWAISGKEVGKKCGTPHIQGFVYFKSVKARSQIKKLLGACWFEGQKGNFSQNHNYCSKDATDVVEIGTRPCDDEAKGVLGKRSHEERWALAKAGKFEEMDPESIKIYEYIFAKYAPKPTDLDKLDNIWFIGPSGCGKSKKVREQNPAFYNKGMNKWWDGYAREDVVLIDDFAPEHAKYLTWYMKTWCDHYPFNAEVKNGMLLIRPKRIIVTSQYTIAECFPDMESQTALQRRFTVDHMGINYKTTPATGLLGPIGCDLDHEGGGNIVPPPRDQPYKATQPDGCSEFINNVVG